MNSVPGLEITGCNMEKLLFLTCVVAITVYMAVTAWEDYKSCEVTRWKHLIGVIPALCLYLINIGEHGLIEYVLILIFAVLYIVIGYCGIYGFADGLILANLTLFFGGIGGIAGSGIVLLIMIIAAFSFLISHIVKSVMYKRKIFLHMTGALIPHLFVGYASVLFLMLRCMS